MTTTKTTATINGLTFNLSAKMTETGVKFPNATDLYSGQHNKFKICVMHEGKRIFFNFYDSYANFRAKKTKLNEQDILFAFYCFLQDAQKFDGIGGWYNSANGKYYFDAVHIVTSKDEAQQLGEANKQIAYYDLSCGEEHFVTYEFSVPLVKVVYYEADVVIRAKSMTEAENMALNMACDDKVEFKHVAEEIKTC